MTRAVQITRFNLILSTLMVLMPMESARAGLVDEMIGKLVDLEIGKTGNCATYVTSIPYKVTNYKNTVKLLSSKFIGTATSSEVNQEQAKLMAPYVSVPLLPYGQTIPSFKPAVFNSYLFHVTYRSKTSSGQDAVLSGLVVLPHGSIANGIVVYDHATQPARNTGAPSHPSHEACSVITALAGKERMLVMPDYLGYGVNHDAHPYPLGIQNAPAGVDLIVAAHELAIARATQPVGPALAITGYSEGGGNALWLARWISEKKPDLGGSQLSLIAPMSGNYDMTGAMAHSLLVEQPSVSILDENSILTFASKPLLTAFASQGAADNSTTALKDMLLDPFLTFAENHALPIPSLDLTAYLAKSYSAFTQTGYTTTNRNPANLMTPKFVQALEITDTGVSAVALWKANDNIDWIPRSQSGQPIPTYITGILQDQIVPFAANTLSVPAGYVGGSPYFSAGNSQNLVSYVQRQGTAPSVFAWCGIDARQVEKVSGNTTKKVTINHLNGLTPVMALAAKAIEQGNVLNVPTLPNP